MCKQIKPLPTKNQWPCLAVSLRRFDIVHHILKVHHILIFLFAINPRSAQKHLKFIMAA
jgi:hypothetical protein